MKAFSSLSPIQLCSSSNKWKCAHASQPDAAAIKILTLKMGSLRGNKVPSREWILRINFSCAWFLYFSSSAQLLLLLSVSSEPLMFTPHVHSERQHKSGWGRAGRGFHFDWIWDVEMLKLGGKKKEKANWQSAVCCVSSNAAKVAVWYKPGATELTAPRWQGDTDKVRTGPQTAIKVWWLCNLCSALG